MRALAHSVATLAALSFALCGEVLAATPSFDCAKARFPDEFAICESPQLAELDNIIAAGYGYLKTTRGGPYADTIGIPFWRMRQACQSDAVCIRVRQIEAIKAYQAAGAPVSIPTSLESDGTYNNSPKTAPPESEARVQPNEQPSNPPQASAPFSGTGFFIDKEGRILTNAHVVEGCSDIKVSSDNGNLARATLVARDTTNDLAVIRGTYTGSKIGQLRMNARLGESVDAFGYPLSGVLATSGNFTQGNISALSGLRDDSRYLQISTPVQPGNSGGPLLDQSGNVVGVVSAKINALKVMIATNGDIPQNVN
ncbi:MAG TPA: trypsin-like peptidase domain-containing protein, partial [Roseiarcus sp.]|nr:trypsin-like peptidase domain-containing protein [Roseiarcus sp.]